LAGLGTFSLLLALALSEALGAVLSHLPRLSLLTLLTALPGLILLAHALLRAERVVQEALLSLDKVAELLKVLHGLIGAALVALTAGLKLLQHLTELAQHLLCRIARTGLREPLDVLQHLVEILLREIACVRRRLRHLRGIEILSLSRQLLEKVVKSLT